MEKTTLKGGLFGYRFFFPPMRVGKHDIYLHRPLVAFLPASSDKVIIWPDSIYGYITGYHDNDTEMANPVELWPRMQKRELYISALHDFTALGDHYEHQTSLNIISLFESWEMQEKKLLKRSFAQNLLNIAKHKTLEEWFGELNTHNDVSLKEGIMRKALEEIIEDQYDSTLPEPLTFTETSTRNFEENWWNDIRFLAQGEFIYKDNADIMHDDTTLALVKKQHRDLE